MRAVELIQDHGGRRHPDERAGLAWRTAFVRMPYARELSVPLGVINDTFESAVTWDKFEAFHAAVSAATSEAIQEATGRPGIVSTRFTHVYPDGPAPYYTFNARGTPGRLIEQWRHIKARASAALLAGGRYDHPPPCGRARSHALVPRAAARNFSARHTKRPRACSTRPGSSIRAYWCREHFPFPLTGRSGFAASLPSPLRGEGFLSNPLPTGERAGERVLQPAKRGRARPGTGASKAKRPPACGWRASASAVSPWRAVVT